MPPNLARRATSRLSRMSTGLSFNNFQRQTEKLSIKKPEKKLQLVEIYLLDRTDYLDYLKRKFPEEAIIDENLSEVGNCHKGSEHVILNYLQG